MTDIVCSLFDHADALRWIFALGVLWMFYRWMETDNGLDWRDFVASTGVDGRYHGDPNKVGMSLGVGVAAFAVIATAPKAHTDYVGFAAVLTACFLFLGGVSSYAATLRSKRDRVETTTVTEPAKPSDNTTKTTTTSSAPASADAPGVQIVVGPGVEVNGKEHK